MLKDFIVELPVNVLERVEMDDDRVSIPIKIDIDDLRPIINDELAEAEFNEAKAVYVSAMCEPKELIQLNQLLYQGGR